MTLDYCKNSISTQYPENKVMKLDQISHFDVDQVGIIMCQYWRINNTAVAFDCHQNFISAQYLVNESLVFDQIFHTFSRLGSILVNFHILTTQL